MKVFSIFKKNLKTVSRNPSYFVVLFICPIILIILSGALLGSNNFKNLKIGLVDEDPNYNFNIQGIDNLYNYESISGCLADLSVYKVSACLHVRDYNGTHAINIYVDTTKRVVELYAKQFILQNVLKEQSSTFYRTSEEINSKLALYTNSIFESRKELIQVRTELDDQEKLLTEYRTNLTRTRNEFNQVYSQMKALEPQVKQTKESLQRNQQNLDGNITYFRTKKNEIQTRINVIKLFLSTRLNNSDYNYISSNLDGILTSLNQIDSALSAIENDQTSQDVLTLLNSYELMMANLEAIKISLDKLDSDLAVAIQRTQDSKRRIDGFMSRLDQAYVEINDFSSSFGSNQISYEFKDPVPVSKDPVQLAFPLLITLIVTFTSLVLSNMFTIRQVNQPSYLRNLITPTRNINFLIADYLVNLFFVGIQVVALFLIGVYYFHTPVSSISMFILTIFLASSVFIFIGMGLGFLIKSQSLSILVLFSCLCCC